MILLACGRNRELWEQPFQACAIDADYVRLVRRIVGSGDENGNTKESRLSVQYIDSGKHRKLHGSEAK